MERDESTPVHGGDPARVMELLWDTRPAATRGPRAGLTVEQVVSAAIELADADGIAGLSMRRVAERLGVGTMTLYRYLPGRAELVEVMLDRVSAETSRDAADAVDAADGDAGWRARLEQVARANRDLYGRHPWLLHVATGRLPLGPNIFDKYEHELGALDGIGLTDVEMDSALTLVLGFVHGAVRGDLEALHTEQSTGLTDTEWWAAYSPLLADVHDPDRWPLASRVGEAAARAYGGLTNSDHAFEFGLARVLDGIEVLVRARRDELP